MVFPHQKWGLLIKSYNFWKKPILWIFKLYLHLIWGSFRTLSPRRRLVKDFICMNSTISQIIWSPRLSMYCPLLLVSIYSGIIIWHTCQSPFFQKYLWVYLRQFSLFYFTRLPFISSLSKTIDAFELVHSDVWGPFPFLLVALNTL